MRVWDAGSGKELLALTGQAVPIASVAFSPDGQALAFPGRDQTVVIAETLRLPPEALRRREERRRAFDLVESLFRTHVRRAEVSCTSATTPARANLCGRPRSTWRSDPAWARPP